MPYDGCLYNQFYMAQQAIWMLNLPFGYSFASELQVFMVEMMLVISYVFTRDKILTNQYPNELNICCSPTYASLSPKYVLIHHSTLS